MLKISKEEMKIVLDIIKRNAKDCEVSVFGSRLKGTEKVFADLDLAFKCKCRLGLDRIIQLEIEFEESALPYRVDIVDYNKTSKEFQKIIDKNNKKIYG
ncbi:nucleotidyltransferase family protein [Methanobrevibacter filiformis]|uniref:protein adenylyltransferase n=1 Tax=Methanobrevibacter filiformis TaxID=55758 RepID=A0A162FHE1_9EURY|nr:nucleotidyltransferase domain-containing protein [Methanobrevibacter filiformis]KZX09990.1 nucleotidyltransferase domain protein [Methanobrevibacter filiformis]